MLKAELRKIYLERQKSLSPAERAAKSEQITGKFFRRRDLSGIRFLHCFLPIGRTNEIDTNLIFKCVWRDFPQIETLVPRVNFQTGELENLKFTPETNLIRNAWQIDEPAADAAISAENIDLVLVPLLCFDARGCRVGYGKGFYDKFLKKCRADCLKIGLSYFDPVAKISDAQDFDVRLDFCITPEKIWKLPQRHTEHEVK